MISSPVRSPVSSPIGSIFGGVKVLLRALLNGFPTSINAGTGGQIVPDYAGTLRKVNTGVPAIEGGRFVSAAAGFVDTLEDGSPLQPSRMTRTKNGTVKEYIDLPTIQRNTTYTIGTQAVTTASDGVQRYYTVTTAGTSGASAPTFGTSGTTTDGTAVWTYSGYATMNHRRYLGEPARTNKVSCRKVNPTDTTNLTKAGDAAAVLTRTSNPTAIAAAKLDQIATSGYLYTLDNSAGVAAANIACAGATGNINKHSSSVYIMGDAGTLRLNATGLAFGASATLRRVTELDVTPSDASRFLRIEVAAGKVVHFILPELIEASFLGSPVVPGPAETDALTSYTRAATVSSKSTTNVLRSQNCAVWGLVVPSAAGQLAVYLFGTYVDSGNYLTVDTSGAGNIIRFAKNTTSTGFLGTSSPYAHAANTPFQYQAAWTDQGMTIRTRALTGVTWGAWSAWATNANTAAAPIAATYEKGSRAGANQFSGNYPEFRTLFLPTKATLAEYQAYCADEKNWGGNLI